MGTLKTLSKTQINSIVIASIVLLSLLTLYISPFEASNLSVTPDSVEYAISAKNLVKEGVCKISYNDTWFPMRYPPWFSIFIISPVFWFPGSIGNAIIPVLLFGVIGIVTSFLIGKKITNISGGIICALTVLCLPLYRNFSQLIMTDVPSTVLILIAAYLYLQIEMEKKDRLHYFAIAGIICALSASLRPVTYSAILPYLLTMILMKRNLKEKLLRFLIFFIPGLMMFTVNCIYNYSNFGSIARNGYHFWCPVPYDYLNLVFSFSYIKKNSIVLIQSPFSILLILCVFAFVYQLIKNSKDKNSDYKSPMLVFTLLTSIPIIIFHLLYFYSEKRFFLPVIILLIILAITSLFKCFLIYINKYKLLNIILITFPLALVIYNIVFPEPSMPIRRLIADEIEKTTPENAVIISAIDPIYLDFMTGKPSNADRVIVPVSRRIEYASKLIAKDKIAKISPPPSDCTDHRNMNLIDAGAEEAIPFTALEDQAEIIDFAEEQRPIFIEISHFTQEEVDTLQKLYQDKFVFEKKSTFFYKIIYSGK